jgi:hypothetical protein
VQAEGGGRDREVVLRAGAEGVGHDHRDGEGGLLGGGRGPHHLRGRRGVDLIRERAGCGHPREGEGAALRVAGFDGEIHAAAHIDDADRLNAVDDDGSLDGGGLADRQGRLTGGRATLAIADRDGEVAAGVGRAGRKRDAGGGCRGWRRPRSRTSWSTAYDRASPSESLAVTVSEVGAPSTM